MKLTWLGHSCFRLEKDGYRIVIDPYRDGSVPGLLPVREKAQMVLCTHEHADHCGREHVLIEQKAGNPFRVTEFSTYHDDAQGALRGKNRIFLLEDGESRIAHLGDLGCRPEPEQLERLKHLDVLLIPVGGYYTIDAEQAAELVRELSPKTVIPMHFRDDRMGTGYDVISTVEPFAERMEHVTFPEESTLDTAQSPEAGTVILKPENCACYRPDRREG